MTIEKFEHQLDELIPIYKQLVEKQKKIRCKADGDNILCYESDVLLTFANRKEIPVLITRDDTATDSCRYLYKICYEEIEFIGFSSEKEHQHYKKAGLV